MIASTPHWAWLLLALMLTAAATYCGVLIWALDRDVKEVTGKGLW